MKLALRRRPARPDPAPADGALSGTARVDRKTKNLMARIMPGEIAVIDHEDIDRVSAEGLVQRKVAAVVNASRSTTGRYPNLGPLLLATAGIPIVDDAGPAVMDVPEGTRLVIEGGRVLRDLPPGRTEVASGARLELEEVERRLDDAKQSIAGEIERFAENTISYIKDERDVLLEAARLPEVKTDFHGRHVLVVVRGYDYKEDLVALRSYIREMNPLLVGVDGGADALLDNGLRPDMIIGDMDSVTTETLLSGAELVVHGYAGGAAPGLERLQALGLESVVFEATGTSEDIAMLLAFEHGAELIVAVGTHANLIEFLDKGRKGMASTFLVRLRVGPILVDAKGLSRLYRGRVRRGDLFLLVGAAMVTMAIVVSLSEPVRLELELIWAQLGNLWFSIRQALFS
ncbi:MAG TPA: putative cytokinetic ring protein SteA [Actinomycetota bacterium]|nr:putative cytokinetic ring protein SteA [Actinomycetota bacterium]